MGTEGIDSIRTDPQNLVVHPFQTLAFRSYYLNKPMQNLVVHPCSVSNGQATRVSFPEVERCCPDC